MSEDAEEAWAASADETRRESTPSNGQSATSRQAAFRDGYDKLAEGDLQNVVSTRDDHLAAILHGLQETGELGDVVALAAERRGAEFDVDGVRRSRAVKQLAVYALYELDESIVEEALAAHKGWRADDVESI